MSPSIGGRWQRRRASFLALRQWIGFVWSFVIAHPMNRRRRFRAAAVVLAWQLWKRLMKRPWLVRYVNGMRLRVYPDSRAAALVLYTTLPDYWEMMFMLRYLAPDDVVVDVGANVGTYTVLAASCTARGQVVAFEPDPVARERLTENLALNGLSNVVVRCEAVGAAVGEAELTQGLDTTNRIVRQGDQVPSRRVPITTLEAACASFPHVELCKLDTEGQEISVLRGANSLLNIGRPPVWIVEVNGAGGFYRTSDQEVIDHFAIHGYSPYQYHPTDNWLQRITGQSGNDNNLIFIREDTLPGVQQRLRSAVDGAPGRSPNKPLTEAEPWRRPAV